MVAASVDVALDFAGSQQRRASDRLAAACHQTLPGFETFDNGPLSLARHNLDRLAGAMREVVGG